MIVSSENDSFYSKTVMGEHSDSLPVIHQAQAKLISEVVTGGRESRLLDIGSGAGVGAVLIARLAQIDTVVCIDLSIPALQKVKGLGFLPLIATAEGCKLPFADESFEIVIFNEVVEHLVDTDSIMEEIHRVLSVDGQLLISTPNLASWFNRLALLFGIQPAFSEVSLRKVYGRPGDDIVGHLRLFTKRAFNAFVSDKGFRVGKVVGVPFLALPSMVRSIDKAFAKFPSLAGGLVIRAQKIPKS